MNAKCILAALAVTIGALAPAVGSAQSSPLVVQDNFTGAQSNYNWQAFNGACLTAGSGQGTIPACVGLAYYGTEILVGGYKGYLGTSSSPSSAASATPDPVGQGALRFTNGYPHGYSQNGAIVSNFTYPSDQGLQVTFTTVTYLGNSGGAGKDGADGISFFLMNGADPPDIGAWGGSLGYSCSNANTPYRGINGGYVGLGIDEYGNFLNGASLMPGYSGSNSATGDNTAWGYGYHPGRIGLRGAGNVTWGVLNAAYGTDPGNSGMPYYPASLATACTSGVFIGTQPAPNQCATGCSTGTYYAPTNSCNSCTTGTYYAGGGTCQTCTTGTYDSPSNGCYTCPNGQNYISTSTCSYCSSGTYYNQNCYSCSSGSLNNNTPPSCTTCAAGYAWEPTGGKGTCYTCTVAGVKTPADVTWNGSSAACSAGTISSKTTSPTLTTAGANSVAASTSTPALSQPNANSAVQNAPTYGATTDLRPTAVQKTCKSGALWNYKVATTPTNAGNTALNNPNNTAGVLDYYPIPNAYQELPASLGPIANESTLTRGATATQAGATPITYKLKITSKGILSFWYSYNGGAFQSVITNQDITAANGPLPANFRFGFGGSTGGSSNIHEIMCFQATPADLAQSSAGLNEKQSAKVQTGTQVYFAFYNPSTWAGSLTSNNLVVDQYGNVSIATNANWDASCVLTGVTAGNSCVATGVAGPTNAQSPGARTILSWNGASGSAFEWGSLTAAQQSALNVGDATQGTPDRLNFLRGDRSNELTTAGVGEFRDRVGVLGDIIDSSPTWVGPPANPFPDSWKDAINASASLPENNGLQVYSAFVSAYATRLNVVYSGANDGLVHGFRSGSYTTPTQYNATLNDGQEVLAFMPNSVIAGSVLTTGSGTNISTVDTIHGTDPTNSNAVTTALDYSNPQYGHNFYVDAAPGTGDVFYASRWHSWLIGGMGPGGAAIYALDVTDPTQFSESNAGNLVMGEWTPATLVCVNNGSCGGNLGNTFGVPQIRRFHNGKWGAVFGNGLSSSTGDAGVFVLLIDPTSGSVSFYYLSTGMTGNADGIAYATAADLDGDHIVDYVYAGDVLGNVWRFDVTSANPANWGVSATSPIFNTGGLPITTKLVVASVPSTNSAPRIMIDFGTGQQIQLTNGSSASYASGTQYLFGIWDWDLQNWNSMSQTQYAALQAPQSITTANLATQQATDLSTSGSGGSVGYRSVTANPVCWANSTTCSSGDNQFGWQLALPDTSPGATPQSPANHEQVIYSPILAAGAFILNTTIPASNSPTSCTNVTASGWTMAISPTTGGAFPTSFFGQTSSTSGSGSMSFASTSNRTFTTFNNKVISGVQEAGTGSPSVVTTDTSSAGANTSGMFLVTQTVSGTGAVIPINPPSGTKGGRVTWIERR